MLNKMWLWLLICPMLLGRIVTELVIPQLDVREKYQNGNDTRLFQSYISSIRLC